MGKTSNALIIIFAITLIISSSQVVKAQNYTSQQEEANYEHFKLVSARELGMPNGIPNDYSGFVKMTECSKAISKADPTTQELVHNMKKVVERIRTGE
jgi:ferritin-like protein